MTVKYGSLNYRRPVSKSYRKFREEVGRLAPREITGLPTACNELLRRAVSGKTYHTVVSMHELGWYISRGRDHSRYNYDTINLLMKNGYLSLISNRPAVYRLTAKGRIASDYLNGRRKSYGN